MGSRDGNRITGPGIDWMDDRYNRHMQKKIDTVDKTNNREDRYI